MEYLRGYKAIFRDPQWPVKLAWAGLLTFLASFIPVVTQAVVMGWTAMSMRHAVLARTTEPLPRLEMDMDYLVELLLSGLKQYLVMIAWMIPGMVLMMAVMFPLMLGLAAVSTDGGGPGALLCLFPILIPLVFISMLPAQAALTRVELCDDLMEGFAFGPILAYTRMMFLELLLGLVLNGIVAPFVIFAGMLALCLGMFPAAAAVSFAVAQCRAYIYERYLEKGGEPWPVSKPFASAYDQQYGDASVFA